MRRLSIVLLSLALLACSSREEHDKTTLQKNPTAGNHRSTLAYERGLRLTTEEAKVPALYEAAQETCRTSDGECEVLEASLNTGGTVHASLKLRAAPNAVQKISDTLGRQAKIADQWTKAEDLAAPIADNAKKLAMLKDYRAKLESLAKRPDNNVDALVRITRELAQVQSDIETAEGSQAGLMRRVQTEVLYISIHSAEGNSFLKPIGNSLSRFSTHLSDGISTAITAVAYLLPWAVLCLLLGGFVRWLWRRRRRS